MMLDRYLGGEQGTFTTAYEDGHTEAKEVDETLTIGVMNTRLISVTERLISAVGASCARHGANGTPGACSEYQEAALFRLAARVCFLRSHMPHHHHDVSRCIPVVTRR